MTNFHSLTKNLQFQKIPESSTLLRNYESYDTAVNIVVNNTIDRKMSIMTSYIQDENNAQGKKFPEDSSISK